MSADLSHAVALAEGEGALPRVFAYLAEGLRRDAGSLLTTASVYDLSRMLSRRVYTEDAGAYPVGNFKRIERNRYFETVIEGRKPFASTSIEEIATVFFDWEKIRSLGFESNLNLPAVADGQVIGTVNLLHRAGHFTPTRVAAAMAWQPVATLAFLLLHRAGAETATFHAEAPAGAAAVVEG